MSRRITNKDIVANTGKVDLVREFERISRLFSEDVECSGVRLRPHSFEVCFNFVFSESVYGATYVDVYDVLGMLGVLKEDTDDVYEFDLVKFNDVGVFLLYIEYVMSALYTLYWLDVYNTDEASVDELRERLADESRIVQGMVRFRDSYSSFSYEIKFSYAAWFRLWDKCLDVVRKLGYTAHILGYEGKPYVLIVLEDPSAELVGSIEAGDALGISRSVREYRAVGLKGNLEKKAELLCTLYKDIECVLPSKEAKLDKYLEGLRSDFTNVCNTAGIRHGDPKEKPAEKFKRMSDAELEVWYDNAYTMYLHIKLALEYRQIRKDLADLRRD